MIIIFIFLKAPCDEVTCGEHAFCKPDGHEAYCICEEGWTFNPNDIAAGCIGEDQVLENKLRLPLYCDKSQITNSFFPD